MNFLKWMNDMSGDPLEILLTWNYEIREKVADSLKPYIYIDRYTKDIKFKDTIDNDVLRRSVFELANAVKYELGFKEKGRISEKRAIELLNLLNSEKND